MSTARPLFDPPLVRRALWDAIARLDPRHLAKNPVMLVVEVGSAFTTLLGVVALAGGPADAPASFIFAISAWLWATVLFANFAEAMAEGRGRAQADALRAARRDVMATVLDAPAFDARSRSVPSSNLANGDVVLVVAGETVPADGEILVGAATVDESAITGESAPVVREAGGDRSAVTGGTRVLSDRLVVRVATSASGSFLDRMIAMVEGSQRQRTPNEIALDILLAALTIVFLLATVTLLPFSAFAVSAAGRGAPVSLTVLVALLVCLIPTTIGGLLSAIGVAGLDRL
ncbi:MAG TPA: HAD-IC family P-type ATPase, partial [Myxococcota bacterium]|nr:HAD-IC family P-type ATPase [Myxococcota bacterium]